MVLCKSAKFVLIVEMLLGFQQNGLLLAWIECETVENSVENVKKMISEYLLFLLCNWVMLWIMWIIC